jgi:CRP-like cAMP-binding protein
MGMTPRFAALRAVPELAHCSNSEISSLVTSVDEIRLPAGAVVARAGRYCTELLVVIEGTLRTTALRIGPGESLGWAAMWDRSINQATVIAESDVRLLVIGHAQFRAFKAAAYPPLLRLGQDRLADQQVRGVAL